jgi:hypothetical protein
MKKVMMLTVVLGLFLAATAGASPWPCDCVGGYNPYTTPTFWYLLDYTGTPLQDGDCVCAYWVGPDGLVDGVYPANAPEALPDDEKLNCYFIEYGGFFFSVTTYAATDLGHPQAGELIYMVIYDGPCDALTPANYYGMSGTYAVQNFLGETAYFLFPGDPGYGYTDTPLPVELVSFTATGRNGEVLLEWVTASETNALGFHIERDGERVTVDLIAAAGNSTTENTYTYVDKGLENGVTYSYNLISVDIDGVEQVANENPIQATPAASLPGQFALHQNYPNPFNPATEIKYDLAQDAPVTLKIYNILGAEVATLVDDHQKAGYYTQSWSARDMASGVYFCALTAGDFKAVKKMVFLK